MRGCSSPPRRRPALRRQGAPPGSPCHPRSPLQLSRLAGGGGGGRARAGAGAGAYGLWHVVDVPRAASGWPSQPPSLTLDPRRGPGRRAGGGASACNAAVAANSFNKLESAAARPCGPPAQRWVDSAVRPGIAGVSWGAGMPAMGAGALVHELLRTCCPPPHTPWCRRAPSSSKHTFLGRWQPGAAPRPPT